MLATLALARLFWSVYSWRNRKHTTFWCKHSVKSENFGLRCKFKTYIDSRILVVCVVNSTVIFGKKDRVINYINSFQNDRLHYKLQLKSPTPPCEKPAYCRSYLQYMHSESCSFYWTKVFLQPHHRSVSFGDIYLRFMNIEFSSLELRKTAVDVCILVRKRRSNL